MMHFFTIDGKKSKDYGLYISGCGTFNSPERDYEIVSIPGRNGDLILDNGRYKNVTLEYPAFIRQRFSGSAQAVRSWLLGTTGYRRLEDSYHKEEFRRAIYSGNIQFDMRALNTSGETTLSFYCQPQRWLKSGEDKITITERTVLENETNFEAKPLLRVYIEDSGILTVGERVVQIAGVNGCIDIDSELENVYYGTQNLNKKIILQSEFPTLKKATEISFSGGITKVEIKPRWWRI